MRAQRPLTPEGRVKAVVRQALKRAGWGVYPIVQHNTYYAHPGISDYICIRHGKVVFVEVKAPGGQLSKAQLKFAEEIAAKGGKYIVARDIEDLIKGGLL